MEVRIHGDTLHQTVFLGSKILGAAGCGGFLPSGSLKLVTVPVYSGEQNTIFSEMRLAHGLLRLI